MADLTLKGRDHTIQLIRPDDAGVIAICRGPENLELGGFDYPNPCGQRAYYDTMDDAVEYAAVHADDEGRALS